MMGRLLAAHLQKAWGQSAVVENRSGGGGTIGTAEAVRSKGDGHTILVGNPGPNAIAYSIFRNMTYKADQLQPVSNLIRISEYRVGPSVDRHQDDWGTDRLYQGQSGQAHLRLLRRRPGPAPHRRLVPAIDRPEDGPMRRSRRWPGATGCARRRYPRSVSRQSLSDTAAGSGRQAHRAGGDHDGACAAGAERSHHARERTGAGEVRRHLLVRHFPAEECARPLSPR